MTNGLRAGIASLVLLLTPLAAEADRGRGSEMRHGHRYDRDDRHDHGGSYGHGNSYGHGSSYYGNRDTHYGNTPYWDERNRDYRGDNRWAPRPNPYPWRPQAQGWNGQRGDKVDYAINRGVREGQLSWKEVRDIREEQREIARKEAQYRADGYLTDRERKDLSGEYKELRNGIEHNLNDGERGSYRR